VSFVVGNRFLQGGFESWKIVVAVQVTEPTFRLQDRQSHPLVPLPTYGSWTGPIERLWRWLKQEVLHLHSYAGK